MAGVIQSEAMRDKRAESLGRRVPSAPMNPSPGSEERKYEGRRKHSGAFKISLDRIIPDPNQPRTEFDEEALERLSASLKSRGQLQPIRVRWDASIEVYVVVVGERRWRAARMAGFELLDCVVVEGEMTADDLLEDQLVENAIREDLKPVEQARSYRALMDARGLTHRELAERLNVAHTTVTRALGLLDLPATVQAQVDSDDLKPSTAYAIAARLDDPEDQLQVAARVISEKLSRAETEQAIEEVASKRPRQAVGSKGRGATKPKTKPLPTERSFKAPGGVKLVATSRKGISTAAWVEALRAALEDAEARLAAEGENSEAA